MPVGVARHHSELLYELSCAFAEQLGLDELIPSIVARCREVLEVEGGAILLLDEETGELYFPYSSERNPEVEKKLVDLRFPADQGIAGAVLAFLEALAASVSIAIDNARMYGQLKASEQRLRTEVGALRRDIAKRDRFTEIIGTAPAMDEVFHLMDSAAASPIAVLIQGDAGAGVITQAWLGQQHLAVAELVGAPVRVDSVHA